MKKVTLQKIGDELGISKVAVYKALNNQAGVSADLRAKVKTTATEMGYTPSNTKYKTNLNFAFAVKKETFLLAGEQFYTSIYYYLSAECEKINSTLSILFFEDQTFYSSLQKYLNNAKDTVSGVFVAGGIDEGSLEKLTDCPVPFVFVDYYSPLYNYDYVCIDNYNISYYTTNYIIQKGHRNIGFVGDIHTTTAIRDRYFGYLKALVKHNIPIDSAYHININIEKDPELSFLLPKKMPTAFVCHCDSAAQKLYLLLKFHGISIPNDVSIISFDNTEICKTLQPPLTSVGVNKEKYAKKASEMMMDILNKTNKNHYYILKPLLAERGSVCTRNIKD